MFSKNTLKQLSTETNPWNESLVVFFSKSKIGSDNTSFSFIFSRHSPSVSVSFANASVCSLFFRRYEDEEDKEEDTEEKSEFARASLKAFLTARRASASSILLEEKDFVFVLLLASWRSRNESSSFQRSLLIIRERERERAM